MSTASQAANPKRRVKERPRKKPARKNPKPSHEFCETRLGWLMKHRDPVLYSVVTEISRLPTRDMLRSLAAYSRNQFLQSDEFWLELVKYNPKKLYTPTAEEELDVIRQAEHSPGAIGKILSHD